MMNEGSEQHAATTLHLDEADSSPWLKGITVTVFLLSVLDGLMTIHWVQSAQAIEANPLMDFFLGVHPLLFMLVKQTMVFTALSSLWRLRHHQLAHFGLLGAFLLYTLLTCYHLRALVGVDPSPL